MPAKLLLRLRGGGGDQPDWTERGMISSGTKRPRGDRAPDWAQDPAKYAAKVERDKREAGELVVAVGPFCVPCGKRFAKQTVYDAHLSGKKHLAALQKMGRTEEAMVCQLDVEAKKRKIAEVEEARRLQTMAAMSGAASSSTTSVEEEAERARKLAEREAKLRERAMLPTPSCVTATSVYTEMDPEAAVPAEPTAPVVAPEADLSTMAAVGSGAQGFSYTGGKQDATSTAQVVNKFTSEEMARQHRAMMAPPPLPGQ